MPAGTATSSRPPGPTAPGTPPRATVSWSSMCSHTSVDITRSNARVGERERAWRRRGPRASPRADAELGGRGGVLDAGDRQPRSASTAALPPDPDPRRRRGPGHARASGRAPAPGARRTTSGAAPAPPTGGSPARPCVSTLPGVALAEVSSPTMTDSLPSIVASASLRWPASRSAPRARRQPPVPRPPRTSSWFREAFDAMADNIAMAVLGKRHVIRLDPDLPGRRGPPAAGGLPRHGQDHAGPRRWPTPSPAATPGSSSPLTCCPRTSPASPSTTSTTGFEFHPGPIFHQLVLADEINRASPEDPVRAPRGDGGGAGHRRRRHPRRAPPVHGDRDPEPDRAGRHLPAAGGPARPVPDEDLARLPRRRVDRGAADELRRPRPRRAARAGRRPRRRSPR